MGAPFRAVSTGSLFDGDALSGEGSRDGARVWRVADLNRAVKQVLEGTWGEVWIEGELADVRVAASGHVYFTLVDTREEAQLKAVLFRGDAKRSKARLERGELVRVRGQVTLYEPRGAYQLVARIALPAGEGDLRAELERIRKRLEADGLLDPSRKRPLPKLPRVVGVATSASGAAMHDIVRVARGRCPVRIVVADCRVQGAEAPASIVAALSALATLPGLDVVIVGRGGGSQDDLMAFNDESVARAIAACPVPVVSAVGHEIDVSIADLVADVRASTPSNAAELVVPDAEALGREVDALRRLLERALEKRVDRGRMRLERLDRRLQDPRRRLGGIRQRLSGLDASLERRVRAWLRAARARVLGIDAQLQRLDPRAGLARDRRALARLSQRLDRAGRPLVRGQARALDQSSAHLRAAARNLVPRLRARLVALDGRLDALSPTRVLERGYAIVLHARSGRAILRAAEARPGDELRIRLEVGELRAKVESVDPGDPGREGP